MKNIGFEEVMVPLDNVLGTDDVYVQAIEKVLNSATNEVKAVKLTCSHGKLPNGRFLRTFKVRIETAICKITQEEIEKKNGQFCVSLENAYVSPYAFITEKGILLKGASVSATDFTVINENDMEVQI
ncbi:hypothetical protein [Amedibacillus sp. YH-ame10]